MNDKLIQVDFYKDGRVVKIYENDIIKEDVTDTKHLSPKEKLQERLRLHKLHKTLGGERK